MVNSGGVFSEFVSEGDWTPLGEAVVGDDGTQTGTANKSAVTPSTSTSVYLPTWGAEPVSGDYCINARFDDIRFLSGICIDGTKVPTRRF